MMLPEGIHELVLSRQAYLQSLARPAVHVDRGGPRLALRIPVPALDRIARVVRGVARPHPARPLQQST